MIMAGIQQGVCLYLIGDYRTLRELTDYIPQLTVTQYASISHLIFATIVYDYDFIETPSKAAVVSLSKKLYPRCFKYNCLHVFIDCIFDIIGGVCILIPWKECSPNRSYDRFINICTSLYWRMNTQAYRCCVYNLVFNQACFDIFQRSGEGRQ